MAPIGHSRPQAVHCCCCIERSAGLIEESDIVQQGCIVQLDVLVIRKADGLAEQAGIVRSAIAMLQKCPE